MSEWKFRIKYLLIFLAPSLAAGFLLGIYPGYRIYSYVWKNDAFCVSCHVHDYAGTALEMSVHGNLTTCHDCHHQALREYIREGIVLITENPKFPLAMKHTPHVPKDICEACHIAAPRHKSSITGPMAGKDIENIPLIDTSHLHVLHLQKETTLPLPKDIKLTSQEEFGKFVETPQIQTQESVEKRKITCMDCHGSVPNRAHNFTPTDASCIHCHSLDLSHTKIQTSFGCRNCHFQDFMVPIKGEK